MSKLRISMRWQQSQSILGMRYPARLGRKGAVIQPPLNTPDILPTLLGLSGLPIPETVEGEDLTGLMTKPPPHADRAALVMTVSPFAGYYQGKAFRAIRTARYTYVRDVEAPWLLYDNETDPYQMKNLVNQPEHAALQQTLEERLQARLQTIGDEFKPRSAYLREWGYAVDKRGCIPYRGNSPVQGPGLRKR